MKFAKHKGKWFVNDNTAGGWVGDDGKVSTVPANAAFYKTMSDAKDAGFNPSAKQAELVKPEVKVSSTVTPSTKLDTK